MGVMDIVLIAALAAAAAAAFTWLVVARRPAADPPNIADEVVVRAVELAVAEAGQRTARDRDLAIQAAVEHAATLSSQQLGSQQREAAAALESRQQLIDQRLGEVRTGVQHDLHRLSQLVQQLGESTSERFGQVDRSLRVHSEITQTLSATASSLREVLASSNTRGQWGERMAEDVLQLAGFHEGINYRKRTALQGAAAGIPDFTFLLPRGHVLFMDVKFPMAAYLRFQEAGSDAERSAHRATFVRDVRARVRELAKREYAGADDRPAVHNVLLFVPNETLSAFIHESDAELLDEAMRQHVVLCSPLTLFAFLGVIRQAFDNFALEQTSQEILGLLGKFEQQWRKYGDAVDKVKRQFDGVARGFDELAGTRRRALERPLDQIRQLRDERSVPVDGELFTLPTAVDTDVDDDDDELPGLRELGA